MAEKKETKKQEKPSKETEPAKEKAISAKVEKKPNGPKEEEEKEESYLKDIMAIGGHGGLFRFVSQARNGIIVESLESGKRMHAFATMKVSALEDIAIYTDDEELQLEDVLARIHKYENGAEAISPKSDSDDLKDYFSAVLPEYDKERVYVSDIKKVLSWYNLLLKYDLLRIDKPQKKPAEKPEPESKKEAGEKQETTKEASVKSKPEPKKEAVGKPKPKAKKETAEKPVSKTQKGTYRQSPKRGQKGT
jgi:hypothetical protein